jgi:MFS family permease
MHLIFLTLVLDIIGFSLIFPLFPSLLHYYIGDHPPAALQWGLDQIAFLSHGSGNEHLFLNAVLFGGILAAFYSFLQFIFTPLWGSLSDRWGRRPIMLGSLLGSIVGYGIWLFAGSFWMLLLSRFVIGATSANMAVGAAAMADLSSKEKRSHAMAFVGIAFGLGFILGPVLGGFSTQWNLLAAFPDLSAFGINPFSGTALLGLTLGLLNFSFAFKCLKETLPLEQRSATRIPTPWERSLSFMRTPNLQVRHACWVNFWFIFVFSGMEFSLNFLAQERLGFTPAQNGMLYGFMGVVMILTQGFLVRKLAPVVGEKSLCLFGFIMGCLGLFGLSVASEKGLFFGAAAAMAVCSGLMNALMALNSLYSHDTAQGQGMGNFRAAAALGRTVGPLMAGCIYFSFGSQCTYQLATLALLFPFALAFLLPKPSLCAQENHAA